MLKTGFKVYNLTTNAEPANYTETNAGWYCKIKDGLHNVYVYQTYDELISVNPQSGTVKIAEDAKDL